MKLRPCEMQSGLENWLTRDSKKLKWIMLQKWCKRWSSSICSIPSSPQLFKKSYSHNQLSKPNETEITFSLTFNFLRILSKLWSTNFLRFAIQATQSPLSSSPSEGVHAISPASTRSVYCCSPTPPPNSICMVFPSPPSVLLLRGHLLHLCAWPNLGQSRKFY